MGKFLLNEIGNTSFFVVCLLLELSDVSGIQDKNDKISGLRIGHGSLDPFLLDRVIRTNSGTRGFKLQAPGIKCLSCTVLSNGPKSRGV